MICPNCGTVNNDDAAFCAKCGAQHTASESAAYAAPHENTTQAPPQPAAPITENDLPEKFQPISPWAYFGLQILFAVPIVGFIFLIIFSCNGGNINRRNFARSYWCSLILVAVVALIFLIFSSFFLLGARSF